MTLLWMIKQMEARGLHTNDLPPIWAWQRKPDLRRSAHLSKGEKGVRLQLEVPEDLVLFSEFNAWHSVLNNSYIGKTMQEFEDYFAYKLNPSEEEKVESWNLIFIDSGMDWNLVADKPIFQANPYTY